MSRPTRGKARGSRRLCDSDFPNIRRFLNAELLEERTVPAAFTSGDLVIYRVGDGSPIVDTGTPVFLDEYSPTGALVQSLALPIASSGSNHPIVASSASTEGFLTLSSDGQYLMATGYDASPGGSTALSATTSAAVPRVVARIGADGAIDTTTALTDFSSNGIPRSAISTDGTDIWLAGSKGGLAYTTLGSTTSTAVSTVNPNLRELGIYDGQLYVSTNFNTSFRIGAVGTGLPTTSGQPITSLPGLPALTGNPNAFYLTHLDADPDVPGENTLYIADDTANEIQKYTFDGASWSLTGTAAAAGIRGLTGEVIGSNVVLYGTTGGTSSGGGSLYTFTDSTGYGGEITGSATTIASASANEAFRGIAFAPQTQAAVVNVTSTTPDGAYSANSTIDIAVQFNTPVAVDTSGGMPQLALNTNEAASYVGGSGTDTLHFSYSVQEGDASDALDYSSANALALNGAVITDLATGIAATVALPTPGAPGSLSANSHIIIDTTVPVVLGIDRADSNPTNESVVHFTVKFSEPVSVPVLGDFTLSASDVDGSSVMDVSGAGDTYTVSVAVGAVEAGSPSGQIALNLIDINDIVDVAGNPLGGSSLGDGSFTGGESYTIEPSPPTVIDVLSTPNSAIYKAGGVVNISVAFSSAVTVVGTPVLRLSSGENASYVGGTGTQTLEFQYIVQPGDTSSDLDYTGTDALVLAGGSILDAFNNPAVLTLPNPGDPGSLGANDNIVIDTTAPTITNVISSTPDGAYKAGSVIDLVVQFNEPLSVDVSAGTPVLLLAASASGVQADFLSSAASTLTFQYTVQPGDASSDLDYFSTTALDAAGGIITDAAGNLAILTLPIPESTGSLSANANLVIDTAAPSAPTIALANDTGDSDADGITSDGAISISGVEPGASVQFSIDNGTTWQGSFIPVEGPNQVMVRQVDEAGNIGPPSDLLSFTLDTTVASPTLSLMNDTGLSGSDFITNDGSLSIQAVETGALIQFSNDGGATWLPDFSAVEGVNSVEVRQIDIAGNVSAVSNELTFTFDAIPPDAPMVALSNDTGSSDTDLLTSDGALTLGGVESGAQIEYSTNDGATWQSDFLAVEGPNTVMVRQVDVAGNVGAASSPFAFVLDTTTPSAPGIMLANDTGFSDSDGITSDGSLALNGVEFGASVQYSTDGGTTWLTVPNIVEGINSVEVRQVDGAGNIGPPSMGLTYTLDTTAEAPILTLADDTGISNTDAITMNGAILPSGVENGAEVQYSIDNGTTWASSFSPVEGLNVVLSRQIDVAGNVSADSNSLTFTLDTMAPAAPTLALAHDTGESATDFITDDGSIALDGIEPGATVQYSTDNGATWQPTFSPVEGLNNILSRQVDVAGNIGDASSLTFTLDTTAPAAPGISLANDTGFSSSDRITSDGSLTISGVEIGAVVEYSVDGGTTWFLSFSALEGNNTVMVRQTDLAGNVSADSTSLTFILDSFAAAPTVTLADDTGSSGSDDITKDGSLSLSGVEAGAIVQYSIDAGATWVSSFTAIEGPNSIQVRQQDVAGNVSLASESLIFTLDVTPPAAPSVALLHDTGLSSTDLITSDGSLTLGSVEPDAEIQYSVDGGNTWTTAFAAVEGRNNIIARQLDVAGNAGAASPLFSFILDTIPPITPGVALSNDTGSSAVDRITSDGSLTLSEIEEDATVQYSIDGGNTWNSAFAAVEGVNRVEARQLDLAGNVGASSSPLSFTLDTTAPAPPSIFLATDTGAFNDDLVTSDGELSVDGLEPNAAIQYSTDNGATWTSTFSAQEGVNNVLSRQVDVAGNISTASNVLAFTLDTIPPGTPTAAIAHDSGFSGTDLVTNDGSLSLGGVELGATVQYSLDGGASWSGSFSAVEGVNAVAVRQVDAAGNAGPPSAVLTFTLDTIANPPIIALTDDTGSSTSDRITNIGALTLSGVETGSRVEYSVDGGSTWSPTFVAVEGSNSVQARQTDIAGNVSAASPAFIFTLKTTPPAVSAPALDPASDSGSSNIDEVTNISTPLITGTAEDSATIQLFGGGQLLGAATAVGGRWAITSIPLSDGPHVVFAKATDAAGNTVNSTSLTFSVDTSQPTVVVSRSTGQPGQIIASTANISASFTLTFNQSVSNLNPSSISVIGTTGGRLASLSGSGATYAVTVSGITRPGSLSLAVAAGAASDLAGNVSQASGSGDQVAVEFATHTTLAVSPAGLKAGDSLSARATVGAPAGTTPSGSVLFTLTGPGGSTNITANLAGGSASTSFTSLSPGNYSLSASYQPTLASGYVVSSASDSFTVASKLPTGQNSIGQYSAAAGTTVTQYDAAGNVIGSFAPFTPSESPGGIRIAEADITGDGIPDLIAVTGPGVPAELRAFDGATHQLLYSEPLLDGFTGGAFVAAGDLNGDGKADLAITPDQGGGPRVTILNGPDGQTLANFFGIEDANFRGGARATIGDLNGDGVNDIVVSAGFGGGPRTAGYDGKTLFGGSQPTHLFHDFFLFEDALRNGAYITIGDINGDGFGDIIGGAGPGGGPRVLAISGKELTTDGSIVPLANFFAGDDNFRGGVRVAAKDENGDGTADVITGSGDTGNLFEFTGADLLSGSAAPGRSVELGGVVDGVYVG